MNELDSRLDRVQRLALIGGGVLLLFSLAGLLFDPAQFMRAYLLAYLLWLAIVLGSLALALLHHLAGGLWGLLLLRFWEANVRLLPVAVVLFVPIVFGLRSLYLWTLPSLVAGDELLEHKQPYLNVPFFLIRSVLYFAVWLALAYFTNRWSREQDERFDPLRARRLRRLSAGGLLAFGLTASFAIIDWMMSLEPHWYSTIYPAMVAMGAVLAAFAASLAVAGALARWPPLATAATPRLWNDLGSLLLTLVMLWAYLAFSQYLIIWYGNILEEVPWYVRRQVGGWEWVAGGLIVFSFAMPFLILLSRDLKRNASRLALVAGFVLVTRFIDLLWLVVPAFDLTVLGITWLDLTLPLGLGGLWLAAFLWQLRRYPLLPQYDPRLQPRTEVQRAQA